MTTKRIRLFMLLFYSLPYVYLAMQGDARFGTLFFYAVLFIAFAILFTVAIITNSVRTFFLGQLLSFLSSFFFTSIFLSTEWSWYFKPFTPRGLVLFVSVILFLIQFGLFSLFKKREKQRDSI